jgi:hypothetical protein
MFATNWNDDFLQNLGLGTEEQILNFAYYCYQLKVGVVQAHTFVDSKLNSSVGSLSPSSQSITTTASGSLDISTFRLAYDK